MAGEVSPADHRRGEPRERRGDAGVNSVQGRAHRRLPRHTLGGGPAYVSFRVVQPASVTRRLWGRTPAAHYPVTVFAEDDDSGKLLDRAVRSCPESGLSCRSKQSVAASNHWAAVSAIAAMQSPHSWNEPTPYLLTRRWCDKEENPPDAYARTRLRVPADL